MRPNHTYSITGLKRWSCKVKNIPDIPLIKQLHVYDFDNTLFSSPLPNPQLWNRETIGKLQTEHTFINGGWWHDPSILAATGEGVEIEEPRAWNGWWNEVIVELVKLSIQQKDILTVLLTGRGEARFAELVNKIVDSRELDFDLVVLKPEVGPQNQRFSSTMDFKQDFLRDLVFTYRYAEEIRVYEDRPKHVKGFREYFERLNKSLLSHKIDEPPPPRKPIIADVIHVCEQNSVLDMQLETLVVQNLLNAHNASLSTSQANPRASSSRYSIKENFIYCGYLIQPSDSARLISLTNIPPSAIDSSEVRLMASNILISPYKPTEAILKRVGGYGKKVTWQVTGVAKLEDRIWACKVASVPESEKTYTHDPTSIVVLAFRKGTRPIDASKIQKWDSVPPEKAYVFETVVGDKVVLRIEEEDDDTGLDGGVAYGDRAGGRYNANLANSQKRKWRERGSRSPEYKGKENYSSGLPLKQINGERDDGIWMAGNGFTRNQNNIQGTSSGAGDRHGQARYFNQMNAGPKQGHVGNRNARNQGHNAGGNNNFRNHNNNQQNNQGRNERNNRGGGGGGGRNNRGNAVGGMRGGNNANGPPGYRSLDDYGPSGFDGAAEMGRGGNGNGEVVMNY